MLSRKCECCGRIKYLRRGRWIVNIKSKGSPSPTKTHARVVLGVKDPLLHVHHRNGDASDDNPDNLEIIPRRQHLRLHAEESLRGTPEKRRKQREIVRKSNSTRWQNIEWAAKMRMKFVEINRLSSQKRRRKKQ